jgi:hypothetical protein
MNEHVTQLDTPSATATSRCLDVGQRFFFFTADIERVLT